MLPLKFIKFVRTLCVYALIFSLSSLWGTKEVVQEAPVTNLLSKTPTLFELSRKCFDELPEKTDKYKTILSADEFKKTLEDCQKKYKESAFGKAENWLNGLAPDLATFPANKAWDCVQKCEFTETREICVIGDLHGSIHALLRILLRLGAEDKLYDFKIIKDNFYIVFLGDYVDRGNYGAEVLYTLCLLKMANWDQVFLLRGNHEYSAAWDVYGFVKTALGVIKNESTGEKSIARESGELEIKFGSDGNKTTVAEIVSAAIKLVRYFPLALFIKSKATYNGFWDWLTGPGDSVIMCAHGGVVANYSPKKLLKASKEIYEHIPALGYRQDCDSENLSVISQTAWAGSFNWSDFDYKEGDLDFNRQRGVGLIFHKDMTLKYLRSNKINVVLRGHEHGDFGLKMLGKAGGENSKGLVLNAGKQAHWTDIVPESQRVNNEILVHKYYPIFTFSAASGAYSCYQPYDCYGILTTAKRWQDWSLKVSEVLATNSSVVKSRGRV